MFKELFPIAERAPLMLMVSRDGDKLRVGITQKKGEDDDFVPLNISILATPAELDASCRSRSRKVRRCSRARRPSPSPSR
jgi:PRTRC genetic system protein E